jgi:hypothetical protein
MVKGSLPAIDRQLCGIGYYIKYLSKFIRRQITMHRLAASISLSLTAP